MGFSATVTAARTQSASTVMINRKGPVLIENRKARAARAAEAAVFTRFDPARDKVDLKDPLAPRDFRPQIARHLSPLRFVDLPPD